LTTKLFAGIPNTNVQQPDYSQPRLPFDKDNLGMLVHLIPKHDVEQIDINWILPRSEKEFLTKPLEYFKFLFSHRGPNSLFRHLKTEGLAQEISCSYDHYMGLFTVFSL
jgi:secreted Zn-dependent insulinase-like peptidase